jgi:uncharacterized protein
MRSNWKTEPHVVLDACALIAFFNDEPGSDVVAAVLQEAPSVEISVVDLLEIAYDAVRRSGDPGSAGELLEAVQQLPINIHWNISDPVFHHAAYFKARFRISLADAFALALAKTLGGPVATSDHHEFDHLETEDAARFIWIR